MICVFIKKELEDGGVAVGFCNFGLEVVNISYKDFDKLGLSGKFNVRDLWRQKDLSVVDTKGGELSLNVTAHSVLLYKLQNVK